LATSYNEVFEFGEVNSASRPQDRTDVAHFYAVANAPEVWNSVAQQITQARMTPLTEKARTFALINMAISDGLITVMESKYFYVRWRPVTAIRAGDTDGNPATEPNPSFTPLITTPPFPSYPPAHASTSYGAREVLERLFGSGPYTITLSSPGIPSTVLHYTSLRAITEDIDDARVYGGIHFRYDQEAGGVRAIA
jgi:PAP2 superfamily